MTEIYPGDSVINALGNAGQATAGYGDTGMIHTLIGQTPHYNNLLKRENWLDRVLAAYNCCRVYKDSTDGDLQFSVYTSGENSRVSYAGSLNNDLTDDAVNYIYLTAAGALTVNTAGFPDAAVTPHVPLAQIAVGSASHSATSGEYDVYYDITDARRVLDVLSGATAAEINALTDGSDADSLHRHYVGSVQVTSIDNTDSPYTVVAADNVIFADSTSGNITINLPAAASNEHRMLVIKHVGSGNDVVIDGNASETIDGETTVTISNQYESLTIACDGTRWLII